MQQRGFKGPPSSLSVRGWKHLPVGCLFQHKVNILINSTEKKKKKKHRLCTMTDDTGERSGATSSSAMAPLPPAALSCPWEVLEYYWNAAACQHAVQRWLILTHTAHPTPPLSLHKVIAVRERALQRVAFAPRACRVRLGNKRAKSVLLRHSQILPLSLCCSR